MLVKAAVRVHLVHNIYVTFSRVVRKEYVNMVSVHAFRAADITISIIHRLLPLFAVGVCSTTHAALRLLDCYIVAVNLDVPFLVIAGLLLRFSRICVRLCFCFSYLPFLIPVSLNLSHRIL